MVSSQTNPADVAGPAVTVSERGFVTEEVVSPSYAAAGVRYVYPTYFWGAAVAGTLFVLSLFALSYFLMLGCHVGVTSSGTLALGWGSAVWIVITSCIAYYIGGAISNMIGRSLGTGWLRGAAVWGLSIPLAAIILAVIAGGTGLLTGLTIPQTGINAVNNAQSVANNLQPSVGGLNFGFVWTAFIALICGLVFSVIGSGSTAPMSAAMAAQGRMERRPCP